MRLPGFLYRLLIVLSVPTVGIGQARAQKDFLTEGDSMALHADYPYYESDRPYWDFAVQMPRKGVRQLSAAIYRYHGGDSIVLVRLLTAPIEIASGTSLIKIPLYGNAHQAYFDPSFKKALEQGGTWPKGDYKTFINLGTTDNSSSSSFVFYQYADSALAPSSSLYRAITAQLAPSRGNGPWGQAAQKMAGPAVMESRVRDLDRKLRKKNVRLERSRTGDIEKIDLYHGPWYLGRYELVHNERGQALLASQNENRGGTGMTQKSLGGFTSLLSQIKELRKQKKENNEIRGELSIGAQFGSGQEPNSGYDDNYYELRGDIEFPIMDIPVALSGYYTSQDKNREAKASYVHFKYDAQKAKEQLMRLIEGFNKQYQESASQAAGYQMVYSQFLAQLQREKQRTLDSMGQFLGQGSTALAQMGPDRLGSLLEQKGKEALQGAADSLSPEQAREWEQKTSDGYQQAQAQYRKAMELQEKIDRYQRMLDQYRRSLQVDSLLAYDKLKDVRDLEGMSYKDLSKKASALLPEGKSKELISGLTNFDAGMFPNYIGNYTQSGQMLKGIDIGYDIGFSEIGGSYGTNEYIGRDGHVEAYKVYSGRMRLKPIAKQNLGFVYYGYAPSGRLLSDPFFKSEGISLPSFRNPAHILSFSYAGELGRYLDMEGEWASSFKQGQSSEARAALGLYDRSAYNLSLNGRLPWTPLTLGIGYEHAGQAFENNTLPVLLSGTQRLFAKGKGTFFRSFLSLGLEYNVMVQENFGSRAQNAKWGFELATHSKRYPTIQLAYKPYATFRSVNDTLAIEQKPMVGEVWTAKAQYQIKRKGHAFRFHLLLNQNKNTNDTFQYGNRMLQIGLIVNKGSTLYALNLGKSQLETNGWSSPFPGLNDQTFVNANVAGQMAQGLMAGLGGDLAYTTIGIAKAGATINASYRFANKPFMIRANARSSHYRMDDGAPWRKIISGGLELTWRFTYKMAQ